MGANSNTEGLYFMFHGGNSNRMHGRKELLPVPVSDGAGVAGSWNVVACGRYSTASSDRR